MIDNYPALLDIGSSLCRGDLYVGYQGSGNLSITNDGRVRSRYGYVAAAPKSNGKVSIKGSGQSRWNIFGDASNGCPDAGLFIGCTANSNGDGGTALVNIEFPGLITVLSYVDAPSVTVGKSGTLTGNGHLEVLGYTAASQTAKVFGTVAPTGPLVIEGNLDLKNAASSYPDTANTIFHVTPEGTDVLYVVVNEIGGGGLVTLGGRITVVMTGAFTVGQYFTLLHAQNGRSGTKFAFQSIMFMSGAGSPICPVINYYDNPDPLNPFSEVVLTITSCLSSGGVDDP